MIPLSARDEELHARARLLRPELSLDALDDAAVLRIVQEHGQDLATALLHDRIRRCPRHAALIDRVESSGPPQPPMQPLIGLIPGAFHDRHQHTGADGRRVMKIAHDLGFEIERVEIEPFGRIDENGRVIAQWLTAKAQDGRRVALVTLSKGTLDACEAVRLAGPRELESITGWLSLSGLWTGTGLVNWLDHHPWRRLLVRSWMALGRLPFGTVESMRRGANDRLNQLPDARIVSGVGVPLRSDRRQRWAPKAYDRLSTYGPNDGGGIVLSDVRHIPGEVYPVWGSDHYLEPAWEHSSLIARLLLEAMRPVEAPPATQTRPAHAWAMTASSPPANRSTA